MIKLFWKRAKFTSLSFFYFREIFASLSKLLELHLENNQLSYLDPSVFLKLKNLQIFNISNNQVDLAAAADVSVLNNSALISSVYAKNNNVSKIFKDWRRNKYLRKLDLRFNPIPSFEVSC